MWGRGGRGKEEDKAVGEGRREVGAGKGRVERMEVWGFIYFLFI